MNPSTRSGWQRSYAAGLGAPTAEAVAAADAVAQEIREWWSNDFLGTNPESCSEGIMIYDIGKSLTCPGDLFRLSDDTDHLCLQEQKVFPVIVKLL